MKPRHSGARGSMALEWLLALPVLLLIGLGALQLGLIYHARHALRYAVHEAARSASLAHADPAALRQGLARGLAPWLFGADNLAEHLQAVVRARAHIMEGELAGWIWIEQLSPTAASFRDWAQPARDEQGQLLAGVVEIPSDLLNARARLSVPRSGVAAQRGGERVGRASAQTLREANLLQVRVHYAVPLIVPVVGRIVAWTLRTWHGCQAPGSLRYGLTELGVAGPTSLPDWRRCVMYGLDTASGRARLPLVMKASMVMQSPARPPR